MLILTLSRLHLVPYGSSDGAHSRSATLQGPSLVVCVWGALV